MLVLSLRVVVKKLDVWMKSLWFV